MTKEAITAAVKGAPFRPFIVRMADGSSYPVPSPDHASLSPNGRTLIVYGDQDRIRILDVVMITEIETTQAAA
jgi:hypothetical protein